MKLEWEVTRYQVAYSHGVQLMIDKNKEASWHWRAIKTHCINGFFDSYDVHCGGDCKTLAEAVSNCERVLNNYLKTLKTKAKK